MARGVNRVFLIGNLGADPEMKYTAGGTALCTFRLATNESFKDKNGDQQERVEWHRIVAWGRLAEICGQYLNKGRQVFLEGSIRTRTWQDQDGATRYMTEINAREVQFLGGGDGQGGGQGNGGQRSSYGDYGGPPPDDSDIPF